MINNNYSSYFNEKVKFYNSEIIITILEDCLNKDIATIKKELVELKINITNEQIVEFLDKKFEEENPEIRTRVKNPKPLKPLSDKVDLVKITDEDIEESTQHFADQLTAARYNYDSYTLDYFKKYTNIVRNKSTKILDIILKISNKETSDIVDLLVELDIQLDENGNISKEDIVRLVSPFVHNYNGLVEKINNANNLETYLTFKLSKHSLYRQGCSEGELYPISSIQTRTFHYDYLPGNVPLSEKQKKYLSEQHSYSSAAKLILNLFD